MNIEDLSVGDYVRSKLHDVVTTITDIEGTDGKEGHCDPAVWLSDKSCWQRHFIEEIEPVPLTEEIMMKNFPMHDDVVWFPLEEEQGVFNIYWESSSFGDGEVRVNIHYVHELQRLLGLIGFNKKIEL